MRRKANQNISLKNITTVLLEKYRNSMIYLCFLFSFFQCPHKLCCYVCIEIINPRCQLKPYGSHYVSVLFCNLFIYNSDRKYTIDNNLKSHYINLIIF